MTAIERLFALEQFGIKLGLEPMRVLLAALGDPQRRWPSLHIAGTNGKGSVSAMAERALRDAGLRTGRYTSPHLARVEERVALDGVDVTTRRLAEAVATVFAGVDRLLASGGLPHTPTFFEVSTAAAFVIFADAAVDVGIVEVGLGGRYDATNVLAPVAGAITTIAFDHERHLGTTLGAIAREKAGIATRGVPLVVGDVPPEAREVIEATALEAGAPVIHAADGTTIDAGLDRGHVRFSATTPAGAYGPVRLALAGAHQAGNALVTIRLLETFAARTDGAVGRHAVEAGLSRVVWPARLEWLQRGPTRVLIDAAHNPAGAAALASYLAMTATPPLVLVTSVMADKDVGGIVGPLLPYVRHVVATEAETPRASRAAALAAAVTRLSGGGLPVESDARPDDAVARALALGGPVLLAGSIYLVGPMRASLVAGGFAPA